MAVKRAHATPTSSLHRLFAQRPAVVRATDHMVQGVPKWTHHTRPDWRSSQILRCIAGRKRSKAGPSESSKAWRQHKPCFRQAALRRPVPANNSSMTRSSTKRKRGTGFRSSEVWGAARRGWEQGTCPPARPSRLLSLRGSFATGSRGLLGRVSRLRADR